MKGSRTLVIAGGGTGGHVLAGVAVADAWKARFGEHSRILFIGSYGGIEEKLVPRAGYPLERLKIGSLNRVSLSRKLKTAVQLPLSMLRSLILLIRHRPDAVLGVGGYSSGPVVLMASVLGRIFRGKFHTAILEQNAVPGFTNRKLGRWVGQIFSAFPGTEGQFQGKPVVLTGNPVRSQMQPMKPAAREPFTIFIFGGSQGASGINKLVVEALPLLKDLQGSLRWVHQTGEKEHEQVVEGYRRAGIEARVEKFIYEMPAVYSQASLVICRSGSSTLAEIAAVGRAAIFIPFPAAADNHQEKNARVYSDVGAARLLIQGQASGEDLARVIRELRADPARIGEMEKRVAQFYRPRAAEDVVTNLIQV